MITQQLISATKAWILHVTSQMGQSKSLKQILCKFEGQLNVKVKVTGQGNADDRTKTTRKRFSEKSTVFILDFFIND